MTRFFTPRLLAFLLLAVAISCKKSEDKPSDDPAAFCRSVTITQNKTRSPIVVRFDDKGRVIETGYLNNGVYRKTSSYAYEQNGQLKCPDGLSCNYGNGILKSMTWPLEWSGANFNENGQLIKGSVANVEAGMDCEYVYNSDGDPVKINIKHTGLWGFGRIATIELEYTQIPNTLPEKQPEFAYLGYDSYWNLYDGVPVPSKHLVKKWKRVGPDANNVVRTDNREFSYKFDSEGRIIEAKHSTYPDSPITFVYGKCQ